MSLYNRLIRSFCKDIISESTTGNDTITVNRITISDGYAITSIRLREGRTCVDASDKIVISGDNMKTMNKMINDRLKKRSEFICRIGDFSVIITPSYNEDKKSINVVSIRECPDRRMSVI